jgi:hypothetical protein
MLLWQLTSGNNGEPLERINVGPLIDTHEVEMYNKARVVEQGENFVEGWCQESGTKVDVAKPAMQEAGQFI